MDQLRQQMAGEVAALQAALAEQRKQAAAAEAEREAERAAAQERSGHMQSRVREDGLCLADGGCMFRRSGANNQALRLRC